MVHPAKAVAEIIDAVAEHRLPVDCRGLCAGRRWEVWKCLGELDPLDDEEHSTIPLGQVAVRGGSAAVVRLVFRRIAQDIGEWLDESRPEVGYQQKHLGLLEPGAHEINPERQAERVKRSKGRVDPLTVGLVRRQGKRRRWWRPPHLE